MANEIYIGGQATGSTNWVAVRVRESDGAFWNTSGTPAFEAYNAANIANYAIAMTEVGATGIYRADDPSATTAGRCYITQRAGGSLAVTDLPNAQFVQALGPVQADVYAISGDATAADSLEATLDGTGAALNLTKLVIVATGNDSGISITGSGSGHGVSIIAGATGTGIHMQGGSSSGSGMHIESQSNSTGLQISGAGTGAGVSIGAGSTGTGLDVRGGVTSGNAVNLMALASGKGVYVEGVGQVGFDVISNVASGIRSRAGGNGTALELIGGSSDGHGLLAAGGGTAGSGAYYMRGGTSGDDVTFANGDVTIGSVTGAVGSVTGNVGGNVVGSVASVVGAVGSVTGAVGSVTGNVGGNVAGSVGSVTGNVGGNVAGSVGSVVGGINTGSGVITTLDALDTAQDSQHATTQAAIGDVPNNSEFNARTLVAADYATSTDMGTVLSRLSATRAGYLDNLNTGGVVASQADVTALNQSASRRVVVTTSPQFERPESGAVTYQIEARTYTGDGAAVNADSTPTLTATGITSGDLSANLGTATNPATGVYRWVYTVESTDTVEQIRLDLSATISSDTFTVAAFSQIVDFVAATWSSANASQLAAIFNKLPSKSYLTGTANSDGDVELNESTGDFNATQQTRIQTQTAAALTAYDPPTRTEATSDKNEILTAVGDVPTVAEFEARTLVAADYFVVTDYTAPDNASITAILEDTGTTLPATLSAIQGATFDTSTDSLEAIRNRGDLSWVTATGFSTLDAAGVRSAVGLASANLDTQLSAIVTDTNELQGDWTNGGRLDLILDAVAADVAGLDGAAMRGTDNALLAASYTAPPTAEQNRTEMDSNSTKLAAISAGTIGSADGYTLLQFMRLALAALTGKLSGAGTGTEIFRAADDSKARITASTDTDGNRTSVTLDAT